MNPLKNEKSPGAYGNYAEMLKAGEAAALLWLHTVVYHLEHPHWLEVGHCRSDLEGEDDTQECDSCRGLLSFCARQGPGTNSRQRPPKSKILTQKRHEHHF